MSRVRISTTVEADRLAEARRLVDERDSKLLDRALAALIDKVTRAHEQAALDAQPYEDDPDLTWTVPPAAGLPYDGEVPADVLALAEQRRLERRGA